MKVWKVFLGLGISVLVIGIIVLITGLALNDWKMSVEYEMKTFTSEADDDSLDIDISAGTVKVEYHDGDKFEINYPDSYRYGYTVKEEGGKISVTPKRSFGLWFGWNKVPDMTVKIPQGKIVDFSLDMSAGKASVASGEFKNFTFDMSAGTATIGAVKCDQFTSSLSAGTLTVSGVKCNKLDASLSAGTFTASGVECGDISLALSAGSANIAVVGARADYDIRVDKSAGSCNVSNQTNATSGKKLDIDLSAGSVDVSFTD